MDLLLIGLLVALVALVYLVKAPAPAGAAPGCAGIALGLLIVASAILRLMFF